MFHRIFSRHRSVPASKAVAHAAEAQTKAASKFSSRVDSRTVIGYVAGITTGVSYGLNPLFAKPLMQQGVVVDTILFYRYLFSVCLLGLVLLLRHVSLSSSRTSSSGSSLGSARASSSGSSLGSARASSSGTLLRVSGKQMLRLLILGILYSCSSIFLFYSYNYISSGVATTIVFLYPVFVALIMVFMKVYPTWQVWLSIVLTFVGVLFLSHTDATEGFRMTGFLFAALSALVYAFFIVIVNRSTRLRTVPSTVLTFYTLIVGTLIFLSMILLKGESLAVNPAPMNLLCLVGLAIFPTIISTATLAASTRLIGATKASVLGVFEPVTAIVVGTLVFGEPFTGWIAAGIAITMAAITFMAVTAKNK